MKEGSLIGAFKEELGFAPTEGQSLLFKSLENLVWKRSTKELLIIRGYAGTGKTSALAAFVKVLKQHRLKFNLLAPTGRAAQVFSQKSDEEAFTIHKQIYRRKSKVDISAGLGLMPNFYSNSIFIVDEASMIGDFSAQVRGNSNERNLLDDLIEFVYSGSNCGLILMGDDGQLPPVGSDYSPALSKAYMERSYPAISISEIELNEVLRQANDSEILKNATLLRNEVWKDYPRFKLVHPSDFVRLNGNSLQECLEESYRTQGQEGTILITRSNKQANRYNQQIRNRILWYEDNLCAGDYLMVVKNNYYWLGEDSKIGFIANGEIVRIVRIMKRMELHGFEFARVLVEFVNYKAQGEVELIIHIESLVVEGPSLSHERMKELFYSVERDYGHIRTKKKRYEAIFKDPYFNALQVKYAYAVTCHKSQGGQWSDVFIDQGYVSKDIMGKDYYRWLYTAMTRASRMVYLVNFTDDYFEDEII